MLERMGRTTPVSMFLGTKDLVYYVLRDKEHDSSSLVFADWKDPRKATLIANSADFSKAGEKASYSYVYTSSSGRYLVFGVTRNGSEFADLHVYDSKTRKMEAGFVPNTRWTTIGFTPDEKSFAYSLGQMTDVSTVKNGYYRRKMLIHTLGQSFDKDKEIFGYGVPSSPNIGELDIIAVRFTQDGRYAIGSSNQGPSSYRDIYLKSTKDLLDNKVPWKLVRSKNDRIISTAMERNYMLATRESDNGHFKFSLLEFKDGDVKERTFFPESETFEIEEKTAGWDAVYALDRKNMRSRLIRIPYDTGKPEIFEAPLGRTYSTLDSISGGPGATFESLSATEPSAFHRFQPGQALTDIRPRPITRESFTVEALEEWAQNPDGTQIPMTILKKKGQKLDASAPVLMKAYGAYGESMQAIYEASTLTWLSLGGVEVNCHIRGGGELGSAWHKAGQRENKKNSATDLIACLEHLVQKGYASKSKLAVYSESAGGIPLAYLIAKRPDLAAVVIIANGVVNLTRLDQIPVGEQNFAEFGDPRDSKELERMKEIDGYLLLQEKQAYPAVLLPVAANDSRVSPWMSAKFVKKLRMLQTADKPVLLRVEFEGGHGNADARSLSARKWSDMFVFLSQQLKLSN
jgi:prolyl oligopeptidase